ncbi:hypothetical protein ACWD5B_25750 [Streptomyces tanashiensis]
MDLSIPNREDDFARPRSRAGSDQQSVTKGEIEPVRSRKGDELLEPELETTSASVLAIADHKKDLGLQQ